MMTLFDQEKVWEIERYNIRKEGYEEGYTEGYKEGYKEGCKEGLREVIQKMLTNANSLEVSRITGYSEDEIRQILKV